MTPRPFYRSRLFWLGLPGLLFLLWAWSESMIGTRGVTCRAVGGVLVDSGIVQVTILSEAEKKSLNKPFYFSRGTFENPDDHHWFPENYGKFMTKSGGDTYFVAPIWKLIAIYTGAWAGLVFWQRRKSRMLKLHTAP